MAVTLTGTIGTATTASSSTITAAFGTGQDTANNLLVAVVTVESGTSTTVPACSTTGWTEVGSGILSTQCAVAVYWLIAAGSDTAPVFTFSSIGTAPQAAVAMYAFTGYNATAPIDSSGTATTTTTSLSMATSGNVAASGEYALSGIAYFNATGAARTWTDSSGYTTDFRNPSAGTVAKFLTVSNSLAAPSSGAAATDAGTFDTAPLNCAGMVVTIAVGSGGGGGGYTGTDAVLGTAAVPGRAQPGGFIPGQVNSSASTAVSGSDASGAAADGGESVTQIIALSDFDAGRGTGTGRDPDQLSTAINIVPAV